MQHFGPARPAGPVSVRAASWVSQQTLGVDAVRLTGGLFADWQQTNSQVSIPMGIRQLEAAGNLENVRLAAAGRGGEFRGPVFMDSDIYKQLEAICWDATREDPADEVRIFVAEVVKLLAQAQLPDGYLNSYYQVLGVADRYSKLAWSHEMYCAGHLIQAAVAAKRSGLSDQLFEVAVKVADHLVTTFGEGELLGIDGHPEVETALVELYRETGRVSYLQLAQRLIEGRGHGTIAAGDPWHRGARYLQDHLPVREAPSLVGHAVRALYLEAAIVDVYTETGDTGLLEASIRRWEDMVATKTYLTGGLGSRHSHEAFGDAYELPSDRVYAETCAAIASIQWSWRLLLATGEARFADLIERTLYNGFAASTSRDGLRFFYVNPLQRRADHFEADDPGRRNEWFDCACCPPNIMRLVASVGHYLAGHTEDTVYLHQYLPAELKVPLAAGSVELSLQSGLPWSAEIGLIIGATPHLEWTLALRQPSWSTMALIKVNGEAIENMIDQRGYVSVRRKWRAGDQVEIDFGMQPRLVVGHHRIDAVRGCVALERGPLVYCFEQIDQDGSDLDDLAITSTTEFQLTDEPEIPGIGRSVKITMPAAQLVGQASQGLPYHDIASSSSESTGASGRPAASGPTSITAIPYFQWDNRDGGPMRVWLPLHITDRTT